MTLFYFHILFIKKSCEMLNLMRTMTDEWKLQELQVKNTYPWWATINNINSLCPNFWPPSSSCHTFLLLKEKRSIKDIFFAVSVRKINSKMLFSEKWLPFENRLISKTKLIHKSNFLNIQSLTIARFLSWFTHRWPCLGYGWHP